MNRKLSGLDLNGWQDYCVRNWSNFKDDEYYQTPMCFDGGNLSQVIWAGDTQSQFPLGGPEAKTAPHGRGSGWGEIGADNRRVSVKHLLSQSNNHPDFGDRACTALSAAMSSMVKGSDGVVLAVPDNAAVTEVSQERLLRAAKSAGLRRPLLVWRPVLLCLQALKDQTIKTPGQEVAVISPSSLGLELQVLRIKSELTSGEHVLAPERHKVGQLFNRDLSYTALLESASDDFASSNEEDDRLLIEKHSQLPFEMLRGACEGEEVLRRNNGRWLKLTLKREQYTPNFGKLNSEIISILKRVDLILLEDSPFPSLNTHLKNQLGMFDRKLHCLAPDACAKGAWHAAHRYATGTPIYFDFLPQVSAVILKRREPTFRKLVPDGDTVRANDRYRTEDPPHFVWTSGQTELEFYIKKEGTEKIRRWTTSILTAPPKDSNVFLVLEQQPGQGRAQITVSSNEWSALSENPIILDWDTLEVEDRSEAEILESLERPCPAVPERTVLETSIDVWTNERIAPRLQKTLQNFNAKNQTQLSDIKRLLSDAHKPDLLAKGSYKLIDSDGNFPRENNGTDGQLSLKPSEQAPHSASHHATLMALVDDALQQIALELDKLVQTGNRARHNDLVLASTWAFTRCPLSIQHHLLNAISVPDHPLHAKSWQTVAYQGLGRSASTPEVMKKVIRRVLSTDLVDLRSYHLACVAFFLSRRDEVFDIIDEEGKIALVQVCRYYLVDGQQASKKPYLQIYSYALLLIGGLLRFRKTDPYAFLPDNCGMGRDLAEALKHALSGLKVVYQNNHEPKIKRKIEITNDLLKVLNGDEAVPNLLRAILDIASGE